jgi:phenylpropionate dioxygenase-like ring-hydroxylating dioxygenase large terminal subunit
MMIGHESQLLKPGDYRTYTIAEIPFVVIRDRDDGTLRAFHNVCRHRAYTVVRRPTGNTPRLSCRYHGWQYDTAGRLVKAPEFAAVPGFDAAANSLFPIHLETDSGGFIFVNFAAERNNAFPWGDVSSPSPGSPPLRALSFAKAVEWETEVDVNWRVAS